jgi:hypothetical protein
MSKTFVYNIAVPFSPPPGTLSITHGLFFDGTKNNRRNTEIRKKVQRVDEYKNIPATQEEREIYKEYGKGNDSFGNDFTNVARKSLCCKEAYTIYIEGIGTTDEESDSENGYIWGRGTTGIIAKVRLGCKKLAKKIKDAKDAVKNDIDTITVTVDVFGFSRGAAAARNFMYNLQKKAYPPEMYYPPVQGAQGIKLDHNGDGIEETWLKNGKLPPFGHLGTALLKAGLKWEMIENLRVSVRFLGVYDTVASYDPVNMFPRFKKHIGDLHLHELGSPRKAVHFTAMDEHRENFSLTRLKIGIEKEFPGVHSDIGGSYNTEPEIIKQIENSDYLPFGRLEQYRQELIRGYWYKENQIKITDRFGNIVSGGLTSRKLRGERFLKKEYSFIPLHFMRDHSLELMREHYLEGKIDKDYPIKGTKTLDASKEWLTPYVMDEEGAKKWEFITDEQLEKQKEEKRRRQEVQQQMEQMAQQQLDQMQERMEELGISTEPEEEEGPVYGNGGELEEVVVKGDTSQKLLRTLRNEYLHWSAKREGFGLDPNNDHKRREF